MMNILARQGKRQLYQLLLYIFLNIIILIMHQEQTELCVPQLKIYMRREPIEPPSLYNHKRILD